MEIQKSVRTMQYVAAIAATIGGFALGTVLGWSSPAEKMISESLNKTDDQVSWVSSIMNLGAASAMIPMAFIIDFIGRKMTMLLLAPPFVASWLIIAFSPSLTVYNVGRFLIGICGGAFCVVVPVYTAEISEPEIRGTLGVCFQLLLVIGILFTYTIGGYVNVMWLSIICGCVPVVFFVLMIFMPETPTALLMKNKEDQAIKSLKFLRGKHYDVEPELKSLKQSLEASEKRREGSLFEKIKNRTNIKAFLICIGLMICQQLSGINAVIFYANKIFESTGNDPHTSSIILGSVQVVATFIAAGLVDRAGRKLLMTLSMGIMAVCQLTLGIVFYVIEDDQMKSYSWIPLIAVCVYLAGFSIGAGPLPWAMLGELFSPEIKGIAGSTCACLNWILAFVVTKTFSNMVDAFGNAVTFWIYAGICVFGVIFIIFCCIETKNKSLEQIQIELGSSTSQKMYEVRH